MKKHRFALASLVVILAGNEMLHSGQARAQKTADPSVFFHVDPLGDDANPGTLAQPFATVIDSCHIHHVGGTAIALDGGDWKTLAPGGAEVRNCRVHDCGYWQRVYCPGVSLSGVGHVVRQNTFQRFPHTAIIVRGNDHLTEGNLIWNPTVPLATGEAYITDGGPADLVQAANNHIVTDDPGFVDWQSMNFTLKQDAPVFENIPGFRVFGFDRIGARAPPEGVETMEK